MAKLFNRILDYIGLEGVEEYEDEQQLEQDIVQPTQPSFSSRNDRKTIDIEEYGQARNRRKESNKVVNMNKSTQNNNLIIYKPQSCEDSSSMIDSLKERKPIIANFENIEHDKAQRILDMMSGAMYAICGSVHKVSKSIYVFAPDNIDVSGESKEAANVSNLFMNIGQ